METRGPARVTREGCGERTDLRGENPASSSASPLLFFGLPQPSSGTLGILSRPPGNFLMLSGAPVGKNTRPGWNPGTPRPPRFGRGVPQKALTSAVRTQPLLWPRRFFSAACLNLPLESWAPVHVPWRLLAALCFLPLLPSLYLPAIAHLFHLGGRSHHPLCRKEGTDAWQSTSWGLKGLLQTLALAPVTHQAPWPHLQTALRSGSPALPVPAPSASETLVPKLSGVDATSLNSK